MTQFHPLWPGQPGEPALEKGHAALERARRAGLASPREQAFVEAAAAFFENWQTIGHPGRIQAWETAQEKVFKAYPDDVEAGALYSLAHLATAPKSDKSFTHQQKAGALLEQLLARAPAHPGLFHYTIHAYDNPVLAQRAVEVARGYDKLAPDVPHALHMPTHIFVRLGLWPDVIDWNLRSAAAALNQPAGNATSMHYIHALDYLMYAYLQQGQENKAAEVLARVNSVDNYQPTSASAYGVAAARARNPLERRKWSEAAGLETRLHATFPWDHFLEYEAMVYFARALGAARSGDLEAARSAIETLDSYYEKVVQSGQSYWAVLVDAQRKGAAAWLAYAEGSLDDALALMKEAAELEDSVDKHPVTPGAVLPARELLGDLLLLLDKPGDALTAYETSLKTSPNRFNSLSGALRAAAQSGEQQRAIAYAAQLVSITMPAQESMASASH
jgi:hypothetical protein